MELKNLLRCRSVAIIGASRSIEKPGYQILKNFLRDFKGRIYPVNPNADRITGVKAYPSITSIPYDVDLAIISVSEKVLPKVVEESISKGVKLIIIITDIRDPGIREKVLTIVSKTKTRILGPSSIGLYIPSLGLNTLFLPKDKQGYPESGGVGIATQSGAVGSLLLDELSILGIGVSKFIGLGREWDITLEEVMEYFREDEDTLLTTAYIERVSNGRRFFEIVKEFTLTKPLIIYKGGREETSAKIVETHTGTMIDYRVFYGAARQAGSILIKDIRWITDAIQAVYFQPIPKGNRIGLVTGAGGIGITLLDEVNRYGLTIKEYIDVGGTSGDDEYLEWIEYMYRDKEIDIIALIPYYPSPAISNEFNTSLYGLVKDMLEAGYSKPVYIVPISGGYIGEASRELIEYKIPVLSSSTSFVDIVGELYNYWRYLKSRRVDNKYREVYELVR